MGKIPIQKLKNTVIILLSVYLAISLSGCLILNSGTDSAGNSEFFEGHRELTIHENESEGLTAHSYPEIEYVSYDYLPKKSDVIIIGTMKEFLPSKWNTADVKRPHDSIEDFESNDVIYTDVVITVNEYLKNQLDEDEVIVRILTGTVDNDVSTADYEASFQPGENVLLYLVEDDWKYTKDIGPKHYFVLGSMQGKLTLKDDGTAVGPHGNISLSTLVEMIPD
ncbi:hypothetical protein HWN40_00160 [Methanolobus zinderi]|uniref:Uncharacterized protein n=1 Tax=Methanolobus zinderi TaxID=536044 RepID=A0A7D5I399_9EURY|nr:hypothetical protein [Methanolobus zinderi]KXS44388.1 MAG: hypothetical protein AWU59_571 [Methanolobus sp. T82-4]QLC48801.1 hypothetical protein HWN40_00160 [Methanolobus zinderi]